MMRDLRPLISPDSIAIIGASSNPGRVGGMPLALLLQHGYAGRIYPINPKYTDISGLTCYPDVESLPGPADLAVLAIAAEDVVASLKRCHAKGIPAAIVFAAGFAEAGDAGKALQDELEQFAAASGMIVAGPNCMGFANLNTHAYTAFASVFKNTPPPAQPGNTALVTQSGNVCAAVYSVGRKQGVGYNYVINTGNEACLEFSEYLEWLVEDESTHCVAGYVEGLRDGARFVRTVARARELNKPLILLKVGDSSKGQEAAASHTASLAGDQRVYKAALRQLGVMRADDLAHMADLCYLAQFRHKTGGKRIAIVTISGALGALLSDRFSDHGVEIPTLPADVQATLRAGIPDYGMVSNPIDITGNVVNQQGFFAEALGTVLDCAEVDAIVMYAPGYLLDRLTPELVEAAGKTDKLIAAIDTGNATVRETLEQAGIPVFTETGRAVAALSSFLHWQDGRRATWRPMPQRAAMTASALDIVETVRSKKRVALDEAEGKKLLASFGVPVAHEAVATNPAEAASMAQRIGFPCVLKILSPDILHKTEIGGVRLNIGSAQEAASACEEILAAARAKMPDARLTGVLLQRQEKSAAELLVGVTRDPVFGLVMTVGLGGILTELYQDVAQRILPVDAAMAQEMLRELRAWPLLDGYRGRQPADVTAACQAIAAVSEAALALGPELSELEVNPLMLRAAGEGAVAVDALAMLTPREK
ncbi:CoA-binding protein [Noviherbaspirillum cavernae]|uniref:CoA-binding protein n=1 Tax=Noviherbaspirillum cavernae TaxID=2320862 RepID=A0A418X2U1_9BURK|nr:acetate--CoA ligase family protein [Noviherbaspirillum cavernae]RJG06787.1 CoA-binding protein [Noviherbaspirillum cavernae]